MRRVLTIFSIVVAIAASAGQPQAIDSLPQPTADLVYTVRAVPGERRMAFGMVWDYVDAANYRGADLSCDLSTADDIFPAVVEVDVFTVADGERRVESTNRFTDDHAPEGLALRLRNAASGSVLEAGGAMPQLSIPVKFTGLGHAGYYAEGRTRIARHDVQAEAGAPAEYLWCETVDVLLDHLRTSEDILEGVWEYLDRDTDFKRMSLGGDYKLALVFDGRDYLLVYLDGAKANADAWHPLRIKARLQQTYYMNNFHLLWYDPWGRVLAEDTNASIADNGLLVLSMPLYGGTVRFQRTRNF